jgi:hypothetical protein
MSTLPSARAAKVAGPAASRGTNVSGTGGPGTVDGGLVATVVATVVDGPGGSVVIGGKAELVGDGSEEATTVRSDDEHPPATKAAIRSVENAAVQRAVIRTRRFLRPGAPRIRTRK